MAHRPTLEVCNAQPRSKGFWGGMQGAGWLGLESIHPSLPRHCRPTNPAQCQPHLGTFYLLYISSNMKLKHISSPRLSQQKRASQWFPTFDQLTQRQNCRRLNAPSLSTGRKNKHLDRVLMKRTYKHSDLLPAELPAVIQLLNPTITSRKKR